MSDSKNNLEERDNSSNDDWSQLQTEWQNFEPDIGKIRKRIAWVTWRMIAILTVDVLILLTYLPFLIFVILPEEKLIGAKIWHISMYPILIYGVYIDFKLRLPLFKLEDQSTKGILNLYLKRVEAGIKLGQVGCRFSLAILCLFIIWVTSNYFMIDGEDKLREPGFIIFGIVWISLLAAIMYWYKIRKSKQLKNLSTLWNEFLD